MEKLGVALLVLLLAVFIGNVIYKETFADCNSPGQMTWTITLNPDSTACAAASGSKGSQSSAGSARSTTTDGRKADSVKGLNPGSSSTNTKVDPKADPKTDSKTAATNSSLINLSLTDLLALIGSTRDTSGNRLSSLPHPPAYNYRYASMSIPQPPAPPAPQIYVLPGPAARSFDSQFSDLRTSAMDPVIGSYAAGDTATRLEDERIPIGSYATRQGVQYIAGAPSKNPDANPEYIRKDSIPCYACSL